MTTAPAENFVDRNEILPLLGTVKRSGEWLMAFCPVHSDGVKHGGKSGESLGLSDTGVLKCFAGCDFRDVILALRGASRPSSAVTPIRRAEERLVKLYQYRDMDGTVVAEKARFETNEGRKTFRWRLPGNETWDGLKGSSLSNMPLYGLVQLAEKPDAPVFYVEGEKACEACWDNGLLAVTHGAGAGIKDFGSSLDPLKGREVFLWPDNDAPGAAYMALVKAKLTLLGCRLHIVSVQVPPKGDAFDYFAAGGRVEAITSSTPDEPVVQVVGEDAVKITVPTTAGAVSFTFAEMEKKRRQFDSEITISCFSDPEPYVENLNLNSSSGTTQLRRDLETVFGKEYGWTRLLNKVLGLARDAYLSIERGVDVAELPEALGEIELIPPLVVSNGPTIFFGDGSSLKSYITGRIALACWLGEKFAGMPAPTLVPMVIDYEDSGPNYKRRLKRLALGMDGSMTDVTGVHYWDARGIPFIDQVDALQRYIEKHAIGILIIDSVAPACGGDPLDHGAVIDFFAGLKRLGLPCILIAHITKGGDTMKPFGSAYWHNEARRTWYVQRVQEEDSDELDVGFYCRKVNDGRLPKPLAFHVSFSPDQHGPVYINLSSMERAPAELIAQTSAKSQVWSALGGGPMTIKQIGEATHLSESTITRTLREGHFVEAGYVEEAGKVGRRAMAWAREESFRQP